MSFDMRNINPKACTGCRICEQVCSLHHYGMINPKRSRIRIYRLEDQNKIETCQHCQKPKCMEICPTGALQISNNRYILNQAKCDLCGKCIEACPIEGSLHIFAGELLKCDLCEGHPVCVQYCVVDALTLKEEEDAAKNST